MAVSRNDLGVLLLCAVAIFLFVQREGDLALAVTWNHDSGDLTGSTYRNGHAPGPGEQMPQPVITDLDGDGLNEVVVVTREPRLVILQSVRTGQARGSLDWNALETKVSVSLLSRLAIRKGNQAVALGTGYLDAVASATAPRTQVILVVTEALSILCYDHSLNLLWKQAVTVSAHARNSYLGEISVLVTPHRSQADDRGMVLVAGRFHALHSVDDVYSTDPDDVHDYGQDLLEDIPDDGQQETLRDDGSHGRFSTQHLSFYAFHGLDGSLRWKHEADDFHEESAATDLLQPQHDIHVGEMDWRTFRHSIMRMLPHAWSGRWDTALQLAHFNRRRAGHHSAHHTADPSAFRNERLRQATAFTSDLLLQASAEEQDDDRLPNAVVARLSDGIEVLHLFTGRPLCRLSLQRGVLHADLNGDGVVDHVQAIGAVAPSRTRSAHSFALPKCLAIAKSGVPASHVLYNCSICAREDHWAAIRGSVDFVEEWEREDVAVARPLALAADSQRRRVAGAKAGARVVRRLWSVFHVSTGHVTAVEPDGSIAWQTASGADWQFPDALNAEDSLEQDAVFPSLSPFFMTAQTMTRQTQAEYLLAVGHYTASLLSKQGVLRAEAHLPHPPVQPPVLGDVNNDGYTDIIITTAHGYTGLFLERRLSSQLSSVLLFLLMLALLFAFAFKLSRGTAPAAVERARGVGLRGALATDLRRPLRRHKHSLD